MNPDAQAAFGQEAPRKPASSLGYWLAAMVAFAAVAGAIGWFVVGLTSLGDKVDDLHRVTVPGQAVVELEAGKQSVYWEGGGAIPPLEITVREVDGPAVEVGPHGGEVTYEVDGRSGTSVAGFEVDDDGRYLVVVGGDGAQGIVAVGPGVGGQIVSAVVGGLAIFFGGLLLCGLVIILTARRRKS